MSRAKVGDWVATFGKVVMLHGRSSLVIRVEGSEITVNRSECWIPDDKPLKPPQRESEQPEQARREALEEAAVEVLKWSEFDDSTTQKSILCQKITRLIAESIRALADTSPNSVTKAALSPQTDSQEPR